MDWVGLRHNGGKNMSLTDQIYGELVDGLKTGDLDWTHFIAKHSASKGPLYNAIGRFFKDMEPKVKALGEVQAKLDAAGLTLDSLDQKIKEAESKVASLEERENALNKEVQAVETKLAEKSELATHLAELGKLGFDIERLRRLKDALTEIGAKNGLRGKEAVGKFFDDLKDCETVLGAESQLKGLQTQIETKKLEAENWQAKEEALRRKHNDLKETIGAMHMLRTRGIKPGQIITWARILNQFETIEQFDESLRQYGDMIKLASVRKEEAESYELRLTKTQSQVQTLEKERAKIEGAIESLRVTVVKELKAMTEETEKQIKAVAASEVREIQAVGQSAKSQFDDCLTQLNALIGRAYQLGEKIGQMGMHLEKYEAVKDILDSHAAASEAQK
jgi:chromosome segregation ATPase